MSSRRKSGSKCSSAGCGSRKFYVGDDGYTYCEQGHQQSELGFFIDHDTGELLVKGQTSRRRVPDAESISSRLTGFQGPRAFEHYLLCLQLVLRRQVRWLTEVHNLPETYETLVKDLWALRLRTVQSRVTLNADSDTEIRSSQRFSSQSEAGSGTETASRRSRSQRPLSEQGPNLTDLLCLNHVAMLLLKIPVTVAEIHAWVTGGEMTYYQASKVLPLTMRDRLPATYQANLEPQDLIAPETIQEGTLKLLKVLTDNVGMDAPPINHPLILYNWVRKLALPLEVYVATQRLARILEIDFKYAVKSGTSPNPSLRHPEVQLMCLLVIATKLLFPFDLIRRYPRAGSDLSALKMDWGLWEATTTKSADDDIEAQAANLGFEEGFGMTEADALDLAGGRLDEYLDWCEDNLASDEVRERGHANDDAAFRKALFNLFPAGRRQGREKAPPSQDSDRTRTSSRERLQRIQAALRPERIVLDKTGEVPRSGGLYPQYAIAEELEGTVLVFYQKASELAACPLRDLTRAVFVLERRLEKRSNGS